MGPDHQRADAAGQRITPVPGRASRTARGMGPADHCGALADGGGRPGGMPGRMLSLLPAEIVLATDLRGGTDDPRATSSAASAWTGGVVSRGELFERLRGARRVSVVSAPAGSGKTFLLRSWIREQGLAESAACVSVLPDERDGQRFWLSVLDALRGTTVGSTLVRALSAAPDLDCWAVVEGLLEDMDSLHEPVWLVIDDLHELESSEALRQLELLVLRSPAELRFALLTRQDLQLGLHRLRLEGELTEIRAGDLRFGLDEARALFDAASVRLSDAR